MGMRAARLAVGTSVFAAFIAFGGAAAAAAESVQKQCGEEWAAAKKAGKVAPGQAWPGFLSECRKRHATDAAATPTTPAATPVKETKAEKAAEKKAEKAAAKADKAAPATTAAASDINETCKSEYSAGKAAGSVPKGTNYFKYLSECKKRHAGDTAAAPTAPAPAPKPTAAAPATPATPAATPKGTAAAPAKPVSPGREAFIERERTCGAKWKTIKGTSALPAGITTWPKYLSYCNARLKANQPI